MNKNIRVICPSTSFKKTDKEKITQITNTLKSYGFNVSFGKNVFKKDSTYKSASIKERIEDLENAFKDPNIDIIICGKGGYNVNQLLPYIDYELIKNNPKIICGMSDNTALLISIYSKTDLITYLGPNFINLDNNDNLKNFLKIINNKSKLKISNLPQIEGTIIAGNLCTLNLLQGTPYLKKVNNVILFIEDDDNYKENAFFREFDRNLESLLQSNILNIKAIIFGKFEKSCKMNKRKIKKLMTNNPKLKNIPYITNFPIGHVFPIITLPIGKKCIINNNNINI